MKTKDLKSYLKRKDIVIEGNTATWDITSNGAILGLYTGSFKFKCYLMPSDRLAAGRLYRDLLGANPTLALKHEEDLAFTLSQLRFRVISGPPFWQTSNDGGELPDENVLDNILEAAVASELKYFAQLQEKKEAAIVQAKKAVQKRMNDQKDDEDDESDS